MCRVVRIGGPLYTLVDPVAQRGDLLRSEGLMVCRRHDALGIDAGNQLNQQAAFTVPRNDDLSIVAPR